MTTSKAVFGMLILSIALSALADASVSSVVVNQRWPWSEKVDVDFVLSGATNDVEVTATWDAHPAPYRLGTLFAAAPGQRRITWDPAKSPFAGQTLTGFTVAVSNAAASAHNYIVVDLVNGGYEFLPDVPAGGWTDAHKSSKMVFRRIPAGTYTLGEPQATFDHIGQSSPDYYADIQNRRTVTFTSDFYVGIFKYTKAQHACLGTGTPGSDFKPQNDLSYDALRGAKNTSDAEANVDWPLTGYKVSVNSIVAKLRAKAGLVVDLCEEEQWEVAARAGTATFWPTGGTTDEDFSVHTNQVNQFVAWYGDTHSTDQKDVGTKSDNGWGLYDVVGLAGEWTLDTTAGNTSIPARARMPDYSVDPTGGTNCMRRVLRSASGNNAATALSELLPCRRQLADPSWNSYSTRFCIHLKPLGNLAF
jgi:formylglycine-generating enzyme required for sulfatase activity